MSLANIDPFTQFLRTKNDFDRLIGPSLRAVSTSEQQGILTPAVDVSVTEESVRLEIDLPGIAKKDIEVQVEDRQLRVSAERTAADQPEASVYQRRERRTGVYRRTFTLPENVDSENLTARYRNGVLTLDLPKIPEAQPRTIRVQ